MDGRMDAASRVVLEWWTMSLMEWVVKTKTQLVNSSFSDDDKKRPPTDLPRGDTPLA